MHNKKEKFCDLKTSITPRKGQTIGGKVFRPEAAGFALPRKMGGLWPGSFGRRLRAVV
jgi:hypothetical protein